MSTHCGGLHALYISCGTDSLSGSDWKRRTAEEVVIPVCQFLAGANTVSDGGRFKGQAVRVAHAGQRVPFH